MSEEEKKTLFETSKRIGYKVGIYCNEDEIEIFKKLLKDYKYKNNLIQKQQEELEKKDKITDEVRKEVREHIAFENRLKGDNREPDLFNQGRFYVANNINNILKGK